MTALLLACPPSAMRPDSVRMHSGSGPHRVSHPWPLFSGAAKVSKYTVKAAGSERPGEVAHRRNPDVDSYVVLHKCPGAAGLHLVYGVIPVCIGGARSEE